MKTLLVLTFALVLWLTGRVGFAETKEGACALGDSYEKAVVVEIGDKIKGTCRFYVGDFFGKKTIYANAHVKNTASVKMHYHYYVAFFDKDGKLMGCAAQGSFGDDGFEPGKETNLASCLVTLPRDVIEKVASYKIAFYESDAPIGKK